MLYEAQFTSWPEDAPKLMQGSLQIIDAAEHERDHGTVEVVVVEGQ